MPELDPHEQKCLADIERYGCHILHILEGEGYPPFSYSVGIYRSSGAPELIVIGLRQDLSQSIINEYCHRVQTGQRYQPGDVGEGFIEGFACRFRGVAREHYHEHFGWNLWLYGGPQFEVLQLVYPDTRGIWPWQVPGDDPFRRWQPLLDVVGTA
jgi:hypothetical protein